MIGPVVPTAIQVIEAQQDPLVLHIVVQGKQGASSPGGNGEPGSTNLSIIDRTATKLTIASSSGDDAELVEATSTEAGLLSGQGKAKLDSTPSFGLIVGLAIALG